MQHLGHDHVLVRCRVIAPPESPLVVRSEPSSDAVRHLLPLVLVVGSVAVALVLPAYVAALCVVMGVGAGVLTMFDPRGGDVSAPPVDAADERRRVWVAVEVRRDRTLVDGRIVDLQVARDALYVDGRRLPFDPPPPPAELEVLCSAVDLVAALRLSRAGGSVPEELNRLRSRE